MTALAEKLAGKFLVFDGPDGAGKGTQLDRLERSLTDAGAEVVRARDPGGTAIGDRIRAALLDYRNDEIDVRCETFLFMASRAQLMAEVIQPALDAGKTVLCDRFVSATCAYQGAAGYDIDEILTLAPTATGGRWPDLTLILDVDVARGFARTGRKPPSRQSSQDAPEQGMLFTGVKTDALESRPVAYHEKVRKIFLALPDRYPAPVVIVDGRGAIEQVGADILETISRVDL